MKARIEGMKVDPKAYQAMFALGKYGEQSGLERCLVDLVCLRASQINHCAYCIDMHYKDARTSGETEQRLYGLDAWREAPYYTDRERAALAWTEALTRLTDGFVPDDVYEQVRQQFSEAEIVSLSMAIVSINGWNRLNVAFRTVPGSYYSTRQPDLALRVATATA